MVVFATPPLHAEDREVLRLIDELREELSRYVAAPRRWYGSLRRMTLARAVQGSNSVEGYNASLDDVAAALDDEPTLNADQATAAALAGYHDAMTYILQLAEDREVAVDEGLLKALHFMMLKHELGKWPGRWRPGEIFVQDEATGDKVYTGPDAEVVPALISEFLTTLADDRGPVLVRAAMAHLNLVMIHPFRDGNGRMARAVQTLVLAREQIAAPVFSSIEEYIGRNTPGYYAVLAEVGQGGWHPERDARPWIKYCLTAHYHQAKTHLRRIQEIEQVYSACAELASAHQLPERVVGGLAEASFGIRLRNASYRRIVQITDGDEITTLTASRDLKALLDAGLLEAHGNNRARYYVSGAELRDRWDRVRATRPPKEEFDPFVVASERLSPRLDL